MAQPNKNDDRSRTAEEERRGGVTSVQQAWDAMADVVARLPPEDQQRFVRELSEAVDGAIRRRVAWLDTAPPDDEACVEVSPMSRINPTVLDQQVSPDDDRLERFRAACDRMAEAAADLSEQERAALADEVIEAMDEGLRRRVAALRAADER